MADANSVSDSQFLLQSMLQRLKLQPRPETNSTHTQDTQIQFGTAVSEQNGSAAESPPQTPPMYNFDFTRDNKSIVTNLTGLPSLGSSGVVTSFFPEFDNGIDGRNLQMSSTPKQGIQSISRPADHGMKPKQHKSSLTKMSDSSISSLQSTDQLESNIQGQGVGHKKWTQKMKEKWKERYKSTSRREQDEREKQEQNKNSILSPILPQENNTTIPFNGEMSVQHQPISNGSVENDPSLFMSETLFLPGSFNLMEEIFTGQEWAKFLPSSPVNQSQSSSITQHQGIGLTSSIIQSSQNEQSMLNRWDNRQTTSPNGAITPSQMNAGGFQTENMFNQRNTPSFGQLFHNGQYGLYDSGSNHLENMDLSASLLENNHPIKEQTHAYPYSQSNNTDLTGNTSLSSEQIMEINQSQSGSMRKVLPVLDLSYLQSKNSSCLKKPVSLNRKRSHCTERRGSNERLRSETGDMHEWRNNSSPSDTGESLSSASSTSSLQHSISQDSESSVSTETVIKRRRVENTRHVRFSETVTIVPVLVFSDDDGDADDEDCDHSVNEGNEGDNNGGEESPPQPSLPRWIEALRNKTKTKSKPKLKLPRIRTKKYRFV